MTVAESIFCDRLIYLFIASLDNPLTNPQPTSALYISLLKRERVMKRDVRESLNGIKLIRTFMSVG
jgi:hypothetical protein